MRKNTKGFRSFGSERGSVLVIVGFAMVGLLAVSALAIDLANFYMARAQAQRAADAGALAGAKAFVITGCTTGGCTSNAPMELLGRQQAEAAGDHNYIAGQSASIQDSDVTFKYPTPQEPEITVTARRNVPTLFAKIFGITTVKVSASATAEAYNPGSDTTGSAHIGTACLKPFLVPNCDSTHTSPANNLCVGGGQGAIFDPQTGDVEHPGVYVAGEPNSGIIGMPWTLHTEAGPSQWYLVGFDGAPPSSGQALKQHILECAPAVWSCGRTLTTANGKMVGPVSTVDTLINSGGYGLGNGQDSIDTSSGPPFPITGGSNNPNPALRGKVFYDYSESPSVASIPVYAGGGLPPGGTTVDIVGYLQVFIQYVNHHGKDDPVQVIILNATPCGGEPGAGGGGGGTGGTITAAGGSPIPIRLIRTN